MILELNLKETTKMAQILNKVVGTRKPGDELQETHEKSKKKKKVESNGLTILAQGDTRKKKKKKWDF